MLQEAGILSNVGARELAAINKRRDYLNRPVEDRDFFGSYSYGIRRIVGDPSKIIKALSNDRLRIAHELHQDPTPEMQQGWSTFCRSDPHGAFESLSGGELTPDNAGLWAEFLAGLAFGDEQSKAIRHELSLRALEHLRDIDTDVLLPMHSSLCDVILFGPRDCVDDVDGWLDRLWRAMSSQREETKNFAYESVNDLYGNAINSPAGRLSETLLLEIRKRRKSGKEPTAIQEKLLRRICEDEGKSSLLGRAVFAQDVAFLLSADRKFVEETLSQYMNSTEPDGAVLRSVMLTYGSTTPEVSQVFAEAIKMGIVEPTSTDDQASRRAASILRPALAEIQEDNEIEWGLSAADVSQLLRDAPQAIRSGTLEVLSIWLEDYETGAESGWHEMAAPFFESVWPKERRFLDASLTRHLIDLAVGSGDEFPAALEMLRPYISPYDQGGSLHRIQSSDAPERFPRETLELLWLVCGPKSGASFYELPKIIENLIDTDPSIETDRRLQWLEQHAAQLY